MKLTKKQIVLILSVLAAAATAAGYGDVLQAVCQ